MKVKINKVIPYHQSLSQKNFLIIEDKKYFSSPDPIQENNFTGFNIYSHLICSPHDPNNQFQYLKVDLKAENVDQKQLINHKEMSFYDLKKNQNKKNMIFNFIPRFKGQYKIVVSITYKIKSFIQGTQSLSQSKEYFKFDFKCEQPFQIKQQIITEDKSSSIWFPVLLHYSIQCKMNKKVLNLHANFSSQKFNFSFLNENSQNGIPIQLENNQCYYLIVCLEPISIKELMSEKGMILGNLHIKYGENGLYQKKIFLRQTDKYIFFKVQTTLKQIVKKDVVNIPIRFIKKYNINFALGDIRIVIDQNKCTKGIKIIKLSDNIINLDLRMNQQIIFSIICLRSGFYKIEGITLHTTDSRVIAYINEITLFVDNESQFKQESAMQKTEAIELDFL